MWCPTCKAEVAAEVAADNRRVHCATCGGEIPVPASFAGLGKTREARELLERWASERHGEAAPARPAAANRSFVAGGVNLEDESDRGVAKDRGGLASARNHNEQESHGASRRFDSAQTLPGPVGLEPSRNAGHASALAHSSGAARTHRIHGPDFASPNFDVQESLLETDRRKTNWTYALGQLLAYAGVALLTVGSTLVLWGYFGGPASYAPTGWLTTMAGQMLLILGVVTLVSGGMEQTNEDVRVRIERLGERMIRFEQIARDHALRGPTHAADYGQAQTTDARHDAELRR